MSTRLDVYQIVTDQILELLDKGVVPWRRPWRGDNGLPRNLVSGKTYRGINVFLLAFSGYPSPYWVTYRQAQAKGGQVRKGEKGTPVVFWSSFKPKKKGAPTPDPKKDRPRFFLKRYTVFSVAQCDGIEVPQDDEPRDVLPIDERAEAIVEGYQGGPVIRWGSSRAAYSPTSDTVKMPDRDDFVSTDAIYSTLFHELGHSTGHPKRLNRPGVAEVLSFGSKTYSKEELVAEMTSAFLCARAGIANDETMEQAAAYLDSWRKRIGEDKMLVVRAAGQAQKAADLILGTTFDDNQEEEKNE